MTPDASAAPRTATSDEALLEAIWAGDEAALTELLARYRAFVRAKARTYFLAGGDREDLTQEGMIGLYKAVRDYDGHRATSFRVFAEVCVTRQVLTAIKAASRQKHRPLNTYVSLHAPLPTDRDRGDHQPAVDVIAGPAQDPAALVVSCDELAQLHGALDGRLSALESDVLRRYVAGHSYQEIAAQLDRHTKAVDNALQRVKRKMDGYLSERRARDAG